MSSAHDLGPLPTRLSVEADLVQQLITDQFPHWADLPVRPVADGGWDNFTFHLGPDMSVRLPSATEYALAVDKEHRWLPRLAAQLPLPISTPLAQGRPGRGYPFAWSVYRWLPGDPVTAAPTGDGSIGGGLDPVRFALDLADFLTALQRIDPLTGQLPARTTGSAAPRCAPTKRRHGTRCGPWRTTPTRRSTSPWPSRSGPPP